MIKLGQEVKCKVTGFKGIAIARTDWLNGCVRITVCPKVGKDGQTVGTECIDEPQLEVIGTGVYKGDERRTGGPALSIPTRQPDPKR